MSRRAYDDLKASHDHYVEILRQVLVQQLGLRSAITRAEAGLPEVPREPKRPDPMPDTLREKCLRFGSASAQQNMLTLSEHRHSGGVSWDQVEREFDAGMVLSARLQAEEPE